MKQIVAGIVAHVDAGKTTLSEALLYRTGEIRKLGRVDHGDAFLDTNSLEKARGITIFAHQALVEHGDLRLTLLDTPGHVDFAAETERVLRVLDYAILVVSGTDGVQGHTETLWRLLARYGVPTFIFVNKCDAAGFDREAILAQLRKRLSDAIYPLPAMEQSTEGSAVPLDALAEDIATLDEEAMNDYLEHGALSVDRLRSMIAVRELFPVYFGSALKLEGVEEFLDGLETFTREREWPAAFAARVFKIAHDGQHNRMTWLRVTGGALKAKEIVSSSSCAAASTAPSPVQGDDGTVWNRVIIVIRNPTVVGSRACRIVDIDLVGTARDPVVEFPCLHDVVRGDLILPDHAAALTYAQLRCGYDECAVFHTGDVVLHEMVHLVDLFTGFHLGGTVVEGVHGIFTDDPGGIQVHDVFDRHFEDQHVLTRIADLPGFPLCLIERLHFLPIETIPIHIGKAEIECHRLTKSVLLSTKLVRQSRKRKEITVSGAVDVVLCADLDIPADRRCCDCVNLAILVGHIVQLGVEQYANACLCDHPIERKLHKFLHVPACLRIVAAAELVYPSLQHLEQSGICSGMRTLFDPAHKWMNQSACCHTAEKAVFFDEDHAQSFPCRRYRAHHARQTTARNAEVIRFRNCRAVKGMCGIHSVVLLLTFALF